MELLPMIGIIAGGVILTVFIGYILMIRLFYKKVNQGQALVRTGYSSKKDNQTKVAFNGMWVVPLLHNDEIMDISLKQVIINRDGKDGLICKDNLRADIKVAFYVRVNPTVEDVKAVANTIGCARASDPELLNVLFESKFSEALKTIGKRFDFVELYDAREKFRDEIINLIGRQLNGYFLDDAAIDYLEQTPIEFLDEENILDAEGIKKIRDLTAQQITQANKIQREKEKVIKKQDVEAREAILELEKQQAEKEEIQRREVASTKAREVAETQRIQEEERTKSERARLLREREIEVEEQNKLRDVIAAKKNKERTDVIETEKVQRDQELEATERERIVELAQIEKEKALEVERKNIQDVIRDRVAVEREVVEEQEKTKDIEAFQGAERLKKVAILAAEQRAEEALVERIKKAEADKDAAILDAETRITEANALRQAVDKEAEAKKIMADATAEEHAAIGLAEARVLEAKAEARQKEGEATANALEFQNIAEAKGIELKGEAQAEADRKKGMMEAKIALEKGMSEAQVTEVKAEAVQKMGTTEANIIELKALADAKGVAAKAEAMQKLDGVGKEHEEFKLRLEQEKEIELAEIAVQKDIADAQAQVLSEALKTANIDIVGGDQEFFDRISGAIGSGKSVDRFFNNSEHLLEVKDALMGDGDGHFGQALKSFMEQFSINSNDVKNLTVSALIAKLLTQADTDQQRSILGSLQGMAASLGLSQQKASHLLG